MQISTIHLQKNYIKPALILIWAAVCLVFLQTTSSYHFYQIEQNQLFLMSEEYILQYFNHPAALACIIGDFLTQFYHYMWGGATIITISLLIMGDLWRRALENILSRTDSCANGISHWSAFIIAIAVITLYANFTMSVSFRLATIIAICGGLALWHCNNFLRTWLNGIGGHISWIAIISTFIFSIVAYLLFGVGAIIFIVIEALYSLAGRHSLCKIILPTLGICLISLLVIIFLLASRYNLERNTALLYPGLGKYNDMAKEAVLERNLTFDNEYYFGHYAKVVEMYEKGDMGNSEVQSFFYCLSLAQMNMLAYKLPTIDQPILGTFYKIGSDTPMPVIMMINELYYLLGDMTYTERAALLANTFSPNGRNARNIKRLVEANLITGDYPATMKYLRLLDKSVVYHQWAQDHMPDAMTESVKMEVEKKRKFLNTTDNIRLGDDCYTILTQLLDSNPDNIQALTYLLCSDMLSHQREVFVHDYEKYGGNRIPVFQQIYNSAKQ